MSANDHSYIANSVGHFDVAGEDIESLSKFYSSVFDWGVESKGPGYSLLKTPDGTVRGALVDSEAASLTIGVIVPDLDGALAAAERAGGRIVMKKTDNGWVQKGQVADPAGNRVTLIQG